MSYSVQRDEPVPRFDSEQAKSFTEWIRRVHEADTPPVSLQKWLGLPEDATEQEVIATAIERWLWQGMSNAEIADALRTTFGMSDVRVAAIMELVGDDIDEARRILFGDPTKAKAAGCD